MNEILVCKIWSLNSAFFFHFGIFLVVSNICSVRFCISFIVYILLPGKQTNKKDLGEIFSFKLEPVWLHIQSFLVIPSLNGNADRKEGAD